MIKSGIIEAIIAESNPERGRFMKSYLKTGNRTLGISMPALRRIVDSCPDMPTSAVLLMIESELHEVR
ncbi:MAG: DNA alkylation repair protein, partial [Dysgonamonadaceae bacterium]|nr:DNA alkylation repair protein [Dysgonamonadaceae bacterium]